MTTEIVSMIAKSQSSSIEQQLQSEKFVDIVVDAFNLKRCTAQQINSLDATFQLLIKKGYSIEKIDDICNMQTVWRITKEKT